MRLRPSRRNSPPMPANGRYDHFGLKQTRLCEPPSVFRRRFVSFAGVWAKKQVFLLQNVEFAKKTCIFEKDMVYCGSNRISMSKTHRTRALYGKNAYAERDRVLKRFLCGLYGISLGSGGGQSRQRVTPLYVTFRFCGAREPDLSGTWVVPRSFVPFFGAFFFAFFRFSQTTKKNLYNRRQTP